MEDKTIFRILIVDDEKTNLDILIHILKPGYTVYIAKNGEQALQLAEKEIPDLILLDIMLPDMTGYDVLITLKESDTTRDIPVIFISGLNKTEDEARGYALGAADYITKPFNHCAVLERVKNQLK